MSFQLAGQTLPTLFLTMAAAGAIVWYAGTKLAGLVAEISRRTGLGEAFAGMLLLGGITSLPEVATASSASMAGTPLLSLNDLLGTSSINLLILAIGDAVYGKTALTHRTHKPAPLIQGVLGMMLMAAVAIFVLVDDTLIPWIGTGILSLLLAAGCFLALRLSNIFERHRTWAPMDPPDLMEEDLPRRDLSNSTLALLTVAAALAILLGGATLALTGGAIAEKTGLGTSIVGFALVGFCTSLPELSSVLGALKLRRYQLAIGDIFGTNLFNVQIIFLADLFYRGGAVLNEAGDFEAAAACLSVIMTGIFVVGILERRDKTIWRLGYDSAAAIITFIGGFVALSLIA